MAPSRALRQMAENPWLQGVAITSMTVALAIIGVYFTLVFNLHQAARQTFTGAALVVVLEDWASPERGARIAAQTLDFTQVAEARFVSREEALERFSRQLGPKKDVLAGMDHNPLPNAVEVLLNPGRDPGDELIAALGALDGVREVLTARPWLQRLDTARRALTNLAAALGLLLFLAVTMLAGNTVRLAYHSRRAELEILDLIGSSPGYIRRPFVIEALLQALAASAAAYGLVAWLMVVLSAPATLPLGLDLSALFVLPPALPLVLAGVGAAAGLIGAWLGVGRALRVTRP